MLPPYRVAQATRPVDQRSYDKTGLAVGVRQSEEVSSNKGLEDVREVKQECPHTPTHHRLVSDIRISSHQRRLFRPNCKKT